MTELIENQKRLQKTQDKADKEKKDASDEAKDKESAMEKRLNDLRAKVSATMEDVPKQEAKAALDKENANDKAK